MISCTISSWSLNEVKQDFVSVKVGVVYVFKISLQFLQH